MIPQPDKFVRPSEVMSNIAPQQLAILTVVAISYCPHGAENHGASRNKIWGLPENLRTKSRLVVNQDLG